MATQLLKRVGRSRGCGWLLPLTRVRISVPCLGNGSARKMVHSVLRIFMATLKDVHTGALPLYDPRNFKVLVDWSSPVALGSILRTAGSWSRRQDQGSWPCVCHSKSASWPRVRSGHDGKFHICASQSEVPWPATCSWVKDWSCKTRLRPSASQVVPCIKKALLGIASSRNLDSCSDVSSLAASLSDQVMAAAESDWRLVDLCHVTTYDHDHASAAASFVSDFWVEIKDHASHHVQIICPSLALQAIHKVWEFRPECVSPSVQPHFLYGKLSDFGFRHVEELIQAIASVEFLPRELSPSKLDARRHALWGLGVSRTTPKQSDPANAHRPLCNREFYPTSRLDNILCSAGIFCLRTLDVSTHLDVDRPLDVVGAFHELSSLLPRDAELVFIDEDYDMK
eukprot:6574394-Karenia_brevis.AAC.1